jgi:hypothetical protein
LFFLFLFRFFLVTSTASASSSPPLPADFASSFVSSYGIIAVGLNLMVSKSEEPKRGPDG